MDYASTWDRIKRSWTMVLAATLSVGGEALNLVPVLVDIAGIPEVAAITAKLPPQWLGHYTAALGVLVAIARVRSLIQYR